MKKYALFLVAALAVIGCKSKKSSLKTERDSSFVLSGSKDIFIRTEFVDTAIIKELPPVYFPPTEVNCSDTTGVMSVDEGTIYFDVYRNTLLIRWIPAPVSVAVSVNKTETREVEKQDQVVNTSAKTDKKEKSKPSNFHFTVILFVSGFAFVIGAFMGAKYL